MKQGDIGTEIVFTITDQAGAVVDLTNATSVTLITQVRNPSYTRREDACEIQLPKTDGKAKFVVPSGYASVSGIYEREIKVVFSDGDTFTSDTITESVNPRL